jgi:hypothetical protein
LTRLKNDKYYTSPELANYIVNKTKEIIGEENITEYLEPSAGNGVFLDLLDKPYLAYDIEPEDNRIIKQDFLTLNLFYKKGRCTIGNPPYGNRNTLSVQFYKKSIQLGDYISFILPISQLHNNQQMYEFDLIYSENLGKRLYSGVEVHCCLNIYRRPNNGNFNEKPNYKLKDVEIVEYRLGKSKIHINDYDLRIMAWGGDKNPDGKNLIGKEVEFENQYAKEFAIKIHNAKYKDKIIKLLKEVNWLKLYPMTATPNLLQWQVYKYIKEQIPEIN